MTETMRAKVYECHNGFPALYASKISFLSVGHCLLGPDGEELYRVTRVLGTHVDYVSVEVEWVDQAEYESEDYFRGHLELEGEI